MKILNKITLILSSFLLVASSVGAVSASCKVEYIKTGPLHLDNTTTTMEISCINTTKKGAVVNIYIVNDLYKDGKLLTSLAYKKTGVKTYTYDNIYTRTTNSIKVTWGSEGNPNANSSSFSIAVTTSDVFVINDSILDFRSNGRIIEYSPENGKKTYREQIIFHNFNERYVPNFYHKIDFSDFKIESPSYFKSPLEYKNINFLISNKNNEFSNFGKSNTISIPLILENRSTGYFLALKNLLFVNPLTLEMSPTSKNGYVETRHFYFPKNGKRYEDSYECQIRFNGLGIDHHTFISNFHYKSLLNTFGDCRNSEYCIVNN